VSLAKIILWKLITAQ